MITIYCFLEGPAATGGWEVTATCECGARLLRHVSAQAEDAQYDIGATSQEQHELYRAHSAEQHESQPFQIDWVDDPSNYQGLHQTSIEVLDWDQSELAAMAAELKKVFPGTHEEPPFEENDDDL